MKLKKKNFLSVNLRFFGEAEDGGGQGTDDGGQEAKDNDSGGGKQGGVEETPPDNDTSRLDNIIQDKVRIETKKLADENKKLAKALEKLQREKLSEDELKQIEIDNKMAEVAEREKQITEQENRLHAIKAIKAAGLDDGSENSLELIDFVMCDTKEKIDNRVKEFGVLVSKFVKSEVDRKFKEHGRIPGRSGDKDEGRNDDIAVMLGKAAAEADKKSKSVIDLYLNHSNL